MTSQTRTKRLTISDRPQDPRWRLRGAALILGLLLGLLGAEVLLRLLPTTASPLVTKRALYRNELRDTYFCYPTNPTGELGPLPDTSQPGWQLQTLSLPPHEIPLAQLSETPWCVEFHRTSQGLRDDRVYDPLPPAGVLRIAGVGDSFAAGEGVSLANSLFRQMERQLGPQFQIVNSALPGLGATDQYSLLRHTVSQLHCPRAIVVFLINDIALSQPLLDQQNFLNDLINVRAERLQRADWLSGLARHSRLVDFLSSRPALARVERDTIRWYRNCYEPSYNAENLRKLWQEIADLSRVPNCEVALVLYPLLEGLRHGYPFQSIHDRVASVASEAGLPVLDLAQAFQGMDERSLWVHPIDHHPNSRAHRIAASAIVAWLRQEHPAFLTLPPSSVHSPSK